MKPHKRGTYVFVGWVDVEGKWHTHDGNPLKYTWKEIQGYLPGFIDQRMQMYAFRHETWTTEVMCVFHGCMEVRCFPDLETAIIATQMRN